MIEETRDITGNAGHCSHDTESFTEAYRLLTALANAKEAIKLLDDAEDNGKSELRDIRVEFKDHRYYISVSTMLYREKM